MTEGRRLEWRWLCEYGAEGSGKDDDLETPIGRLVRLLGPIKKRRPDA